MITIQKAALGLAGLYGLISLTGGVIGYVKAGSLASLIAGGGAGIFLLMSVMITLRKPFAGLLVAFVVSLVLVGRFAKTAFDRQELGVLGGVMIGLGLAVLVTTGLALLRREKPPARMSS
jgi:uncharacterized membrane protein (UPF0136 family)